MDKVLLVMATPAFIFFAYSFMKGRMKKAIDETFDEGYGG